MKKHEQEFINVEIEKAIDDYNNYIESCNDLWLAENGTYERLRYCSAYVYKIGKYCVLRSYRTCIALIDYENNVMYDFLRFIYGYTATSAQHITKFYHDYGRNCDRLTWRPVK